DVRVHPHDPVTGRLEERGHAVAGAIGAGRPADHGPRARPLEHRADRRIIGHRASSWRAGTGRRATHLELVAVCIPRAVPIATSSGAACDPNGGVVAETAQPGVPA